jgi:cellobiose phosphorylase
MSKKYGYFKPTVMEYVITDPMTPEPWINYLHGDKLNMFISNGAGGTAWYEQPHTGRLTRYRLNGMPVDSPGFYLYIRDNMDIWNPSYFPSMAELNKYECHHGMGYTEFVSAKNDLECKLKYFIPLDDEILLWDLTLTNNSTETKKIQLYPYIDYSLHDFDKDTFFFLVCGNQARYSFDATSNSLVSDYFAFESQFMGKTVFSGSEPFTKFDMSRNDFIGRGRTEANPVGLEKGLQNTEVPDGGFYACGTFELDIKLAPEENKRVIIKLAVAKEIAEAQRLSKKYNSFALVDDAFKKIGAFWNKTISNCQVVTPEENLDNMINAWFPRNIQSTMRNGRSISHRHPGCGTSMRFRDTMQDIMPGCSLFPEETRQTILTLMRSVTSSGRIVTNLDPQTLRCSNPEHTRSDAVVWGIFTVYKYLAETGDFTLLPEVVPHYDQGKATVLEHLIKAMKFVANNTGGNGLPLIFDCDWNDMLQVFSDSAPDGESVMLAEQFIYASKLLNEILEIVDDPENIAYFQNKSKSFSRILNSETCWDGNWFKRLLYPHNCIGSNNNLEGQIFLNTQSWAVIAGTLPKDKTQVAMNEVSERLDTECGLKLFTPPLTRMLDGKKRFHTNTPGAGENGGLFLHANTWSIIAETLLGNPKRAWKYCSQILPANLSARDPKLYGREPYAFASWVYGPDHKAFGNAALTWLTGGAAWIYMASNEYILGIRPLIQGLLVSPCIPPEWDGYSVKRKVRGKDYDITVKNPEHIGCGNTEIKVNGKIHNGNIIPYCKSNETTKIEVKITSKDIYREHL